jgi:hypothetical protein
MATEASLSKLHKKSRCNRSSLAEAKICGCFYCFKEYPFEQIIEWVDAGETALCPRCGIDSVLGFDTPTADQELLHEMHDLWFKESVNLTPDEWKKAVETNVWPPKLVKAAKRT